MAEAIRLIVFEQGIGDAIAGRLKVQKTISLLPRAHCNESIQSVPAAELGWPPNPVR